MSPIAIVAVSAVAAALASMTTLFVIRLFENPYGPPPKDPRPWLQHRNTFLRGKR